MMTEKVVTQQISSTLERKSTILQLKLLIFGYAKVSETNGLDYYIFQCKMHGKVVDYPHGHDEFLVCTKCDMERTFNKL